MTLLADSYDHSRTAFRHDAAAAGATLESYRLHAGPSTDPTVDVARFGPPAAPAVIVVVAGIHGVEGYAGAACLRHMLQRHASWDAPGIAFVLVHALNPWGFANNVRVTEDNIDLNRNFVDFSAGLPPSASYAALHDVLCAAYRPGLRGFGNEIRLLRMLIGGAQRRRFQESLSGGQYAFPDGLFYGGTAPTPNRLVWDGIMARHAGHAAHVRVLDLHTGLGRKGHGALISHLPDTSNRFATLDAWLDNELTSSASGTAVSAAISGSLPAYAEQQLGAHCHAVTLEFGVAAALPTLLALRAGNWLRWHADGALRPRLRRRIDRQLQAAFVAREPAWERAVLERFEWTARRLVASVYGGEPA